MKKKKIIVVLDNDECTGQYVLGSVFHTHILNSCPKVNTDVSQYNKLVQIFVDYYLKINNYTPDKNNISMVGCARPGLYFLLRLLQDYKKCNIIYKVVMYTSAPNEDNWVIFLKDCLEKYANCKNLFDLVLHRGSFPNAEVTETGATVKNLKNVFSNKFINPNNLSADNFKIIMLDDNPQNIKKYHKNNYVYGISPYDHMIGKNNLRKFIQIIFNEFKCDQKRLFFQEIIEDPDFKLSEHYEPSNDTELIQFMKNLNLYIVNKFP
jgi:hypothetical protein